MRPLPITVCLFTSTRGHFGRKTDWRVSLDNLDRQLPLTSFGGLLASLKITPGDEALGVQMQTELERRGFKVLTAVADWVRGTSHQIAYMEDVCRLSRDLLVHAQPYVWWFEDDGACICHEYTLEHLLAESIRMLAADPDLLTVRLMRRCDDRGPIVEPAEEDPHFWWSQHFNFQPAVLRSRDFQVAALLVERNPQAVATVQCEMLWRMVLANFTRSPFCHVVWEPDFAEVLHLGVPEPDHSATLRTLGLLPPLTPSSASA